MTGSRTPTTSPSELRFYNGTYRIRLDVAFFINGIPVLLVETKAATKLEGIAEALDQVRRYHREGPELLALMQVLHPDPPGAVSTTAPPGTRLAKSLFNWRKTRQAGGRFRDPGQDLPAPPAPDPPDHRLHPLHPQGRRAEQGHPAPAPDARRGTGGAPGCRSRQAPRPGLAHPGLGQDLHHDHRRQAASWRSRSSRTPPC